MKGLPAVVTLFIFLTLSPGSAGEKFKILKLTDGTELMDAEVSGSTWKGLKIAHKNGAGTVAWKNLPEALRKKYAPEEAAALKAAPEMQAKERQDEERRQAVREEMQEDQFSAGKRAPARRERGAASVAVVCAAVRQTEMDGILFGKNEAAAYQCIIKNLSGAQIDGILKVELLLKNGSTMKGESFQGPLYANGGRPFTLISLMKPPCRHGDMGVVKLLWTLTDADGREFEGESPVPNQYTLPALTTK